MATHFVSYRLNSDRTLPEKVDRYQAFGHGATTCAIFARGAVTAAQSLTDET